MDSFNDKWCIEFGESGHTVRVFGNLASPTALPVVYLHTIADEGRHIWETLLGQNAPPFVLVEIAVPNWHCDMSPWPGPALTRRGEPFDGGADEYLPVLTDRILPRVERMLAFKPLWRGLAGYSLAGLFALYGMYKTPLFERIASVSGSLWYWGFVDFVSEHEAPSRYVYLSLGDKEGSTKDELLSTVEPFTGRILVRLRNRGHRVAFERNEGNHFQDPELRTAKGILHLLEANDI